MNPKLRLLLSLVTSIPPLVLIVVVVKYSVNLPTLDDWYMVPLFEKMFTGNLHLSDLWAQHNEHRFLITRLLALLNAQLFGWNLKFASYLNVAIAITTFLLLIEYLRDSNKIYKNSITWLVPLISIIFFSLTQLYNFFFSVQVNILLNALFIVILLGTISSTSTKWRSIVYSVLFGILATCTNVTGLLAWPVAAVILYLNPKVTPKNRTKYLTVWATVSIFVFTIYFSNYAPPDYAYHSSQQRSLFNYAKNFLSLMGSPLEIFSRGNAIIIGFAGTIFFILFIINNIRRHKKINTASIFAFSIALYALIYAATITSGRMRFDLNQVQLAFRYGYTVELFWIAITYIAFMSINMVTKKKLMFSICICMLISISILSAKSSLQSLAISTDRQITLAETRRTYLATNDFEKKIDIISTIYPLQNIADYTNVVNLQELAQSIKILSLYRLSSF